VAAEGITTMKIVIAAITEAADTETEMITEDALALALALGTGMTIEGEIALAIEAPTSRTDARIGTKTDTVDDTRRVVKYAVQMK